MGAEIDWHPFPDSPQEIAFTSQADIIGYGGAAGGGKTDLLLGLALLKHKHSIIFRREATQLRDIIERSREIIGNQGRLNENLHIWRGLPSGQIVAFGGIKDEKDISKWRGRAYDLYGFDEVTEFTERQFRSLIAWNRSTDPKVHCQTVAAFNPPMSSDGEWVLRFWGPWLDDQHSRPAHAGELRWFARIDDNDMEVESGEPIQHKGETIKPRSRTFIPAHVQDNPYLMKTDYMAGLQALPEPMRSQLLVGDFKAGIQEDVWQVIPRAWVKAAQARWTKEPPKDKEGKTVPLSSTGVDVARGGQDKGVFADRYDNWFAELVKHPGITIKTGPSIISKLIDHLIQIGAARPTEKTIEYKSDNLTVPIVECSAPINIDAIGVGSSAVDTGRLHGLNISAINFAEGSKERDKSGRFGFINKRAEDYWKFREALDPEHGENLALPPDPELLADLCAPRYSVQTNGIKIESKDEIKERLGRSPDCGDAIVMAKSGSGRWFMS